VYVVELAADAGRAAGRGCLYVGETALVPEERFAKHRAGGRTAARVVRRYGVRLRPDLTRGVGPFATRAEAEAAEAALAAKLRRRGYVIFGGQGRTFTFVSGAEPSLRSGSAA
jgi:hypothetical protein